jgi:hypothetical protein
LPSTRGTARERSREVGEPRAPNLEEMDERQARRFLTQMMSDLGADSGYEVRHEDFVMEMPQSGERIRGRERMREFQGAYPSPPSMRLRRLVVKESLWVAEVVSYYDGQPAYYVSVVELKDGKMWRDTRYYAEPLEAPQWRANLVERMGDGQSHSV